MELHASDVLSPVLRPNWYGLGGYSRGYLSAQVYQTGSLVGILLGAFPTKEGSAGRAARGAGAGCEAGAPGTPRQPSSAPVPPPFLQGARGSARAEGAMGPSGPSVFLPLSSLSFINLVATDAA